MIVRVIGWALLHATWQCGILSLVLGGALAATRRGSPTLRYRLATCALALAVILPAATSVFTIRSFDRVVTSRIVDAVHLEAPAQAAAPSSADDDVAPIASITLEQATGVAPAVRRWVRDGLESRFVWIVIAWLGGVIALSARAVGGMFYTRRFARAGASSIDHEVAQVARRIESSFGIRTATRIIESRKALVPFVTGVVRPVVVLPVAMLAGLTPQQIEMVLAHELAHVWRRDVLANLLQAAVETLLFFHPAVWWMSARVREEREHCCDDLAVAACGGDPVAYTETLLALEEARSGMPAFAVGATGGSLLRRALRLLNTEPAHADLGVRWVAGAVTAIAVVAASGPAAKVAAQSPVVPRVVVVDSAGARPRNVQRIEGTTVLPERWRAAEASMRAERAYWIGYHISRASVKTEWYYLDQRTPLGLGASNQATSTRVHLDGTDLSGVRITGVSLASHTGQLPDSDIVIFIGFTRDASGRYRWTRTHIASAAFPMYFDNWPLAWLGTATDSGSIAQLEALIATGTSSRLRADLVSAIGLHSDSRIAAPALIRVLDSADEPDDLRSHGALWLEHHPTRESMAALSSASRSDKSLQVRQRAVFAFAHMSTPAASDTLRAFALTLGSPDMQMVAIDALGHRMDQGTVSFLSAQAERTQETRYRNAYINALANMENSLGLVSLQRFAESGADQVMQRKGIEGLGRLDDPKAVAALLRIAETHADLSLQLEATARLGQAHPHAPAIEALFTLARTHRRPDIRLRAADGIAEFGDEPSAATALRALSEKSPDAAVRARATTLLRDR